MRRKVSLSNQEISYRLKRSKRARRIRIAIYCDGNIVATIPHYLHESYAERFLREKASWVLKKLRYFQSKGWQVKNRYFLGNSKKNYLKYKDSALQFVRERVEHFNEIYHFSFGAVSVRNQKTRWGSCSRNGNLNFNYKIIFLSQNLADYIVVHELCHLKEFNHSKKFWNLVAQEIPDYQTIIKEVRTL